MSILKEEHFKEYAKQLMQKAVVEAGIAINLDMKILLESIIMKNAEYFYGLGLKDALGEKR